MRERERCGDKEPEGNWSSLKERDQREGQGRKGRKEVVTGGRKNKMKGNGV